jgi:branched-chain amino acid transport system ATP-binding protein
VEENLQMGAYREPDKRAINARIGECYELFPRLKERREQLAGTLSGGEQAMVSISRGLMSAPQMLLIDEPSLGLSPRYVSETLRVVKDISHKGIGVFLVEQNVRQTLAIAHFGYVLSKGRVVASGTPTELLQSAEVKGAYFGEKNAA